MSMYDFQTNTTVNEDECHITIDCNGVYWSKTRIVKEEITSPLVSTGNPYRENAILTESVVKKFVIAERFIPWKSIVSAGTIGTVSKLNSDFTQTLRFYLNGVQEPIEVPFGLRPKAVSKAMHCVIWRICNS